MSWSTRRYVREKENLEMRRGFTQEELHASELRKNFIKKFIVNFDTFLYKTQVERDWAYIAKREYRYDVTIASVAYGFFCANVVSVWRMWMVKKMVFWTYPVVTLLGYLYYQPVFLQ